MFKHHKKADKILHLTLPRRTLFKQRVLTSVQTPIVPWDNCARGVKV